MSLDERTNGKEICRTYWKTGRCNYGHRCKHRHVNTTVVTKVIASRFAVYCTLTHHMQWNDSSGQESSGAPTSVASYQAPPVTTPAPSATAPSSTAIVPEPVQAISVSIPVKLPPTRQDQSPEVPQAKASPKEVCKRYQAGKCSKSDCPRLHPSPIPTVSLNSTHDLLNTHHAYRYPRRHPLHQNLQFRRRNHHLWHLPYWSLLLCLQSLLGIPPSREISADFICPGNVESVYVGGNTPLDRPK